MPTETQKYCAIIDSVTAPQMQNNSVGTIESIYRNLNLREGKRTWSHNYKIQQWVESLKA